MKKKYKETKKDNKFLHKNKFSISVFYQFCMCLQRSQSYDNLSTYMNLEMLLSLPFLIASYPLVQYPLLVWSIVWKGIALWNASKNNQKNWFIAILIVNTLGILEIVYLFGFAKKKMTLNDLHFWKSK